MKEEWRDIAGYVGYYQVSSMGRIRGVDRSVKGRWGPKRVRGRVLKPHITHNGYLQLLLCKEGRRKNYKVSRLVALAFVPNPYNLPQVDHINEEKTDNRAVNLQWLSAQENSERSLAKTYFFISPTGKRMEVFNLQKYCRDHNLHRGNMDQVRRGKRPHAKGWRAA